MRARVARDGDRGSGGAYRFLLRLAAAAALAGLGVLCLAQLDEFRGELAFARFMQLRRYAERTGRARERNAAVSRASSEAVQVMQDAHRNPRALREVAEACLGWSGGAGVEPGLRLRLAERAARAAALSVRAAPSDFVTWRQLARALFALGLTREAAAALDRAQELAPPGQELAPLVPADEAGSRPREAGPSAGTASGSASPENQGAGGGRRPGMRLEPGREGVSG